MNKEITDLAAEIQKECHELANAMLEQHPDYFEKGTTQDITNVFLFKKLAAIELRLVNLEKGLNRADDYLSLHTPLM